MRKYSWSLLKTLEFLNSRRPDLEIRATFIKQLSDFENRLKKRGNGPKTSKWDEIAEENKFLESEELMLRNTFMNAQNGPMSNLNKINGFQHYPRLRLLKWRDLVPNKSQGQRSAINMNQLAEMTNPLKDLINLKAVYPQLNHRRQVHVNPVTPIMRRARSINDITVRYPSMYAKKEQKPLHSRRSEQDISEKPPRHVLNS